MDDPRDSRPLVPPGRGQILQFPRGGPARTRDGAGAIAAESSGSELFATIWHALADILGTAAAATLLRRAAQQARATFPELSGLEIARINLEYQYKVPAVWTQTAAEPPEAFHARGISLQMNMEVADLLGAGQLSGHGVSFAADNVVQLKYVEIEGHLQRGISVLKARGVKHATDVRRLSVEQGGVQVGASFEGLRGVLTGLPVPSQVAV